MRDSSFIAREVPADRAAERHHVEEGQRAVYPSRQSSETPVASEAHRRVLAEMNPDGIRAGTVAEKAAFMRERNRRAPDRQRPVVSMGQTHPAQQQTQDE